MWGDTKQVVKFLRVEGYEREAQLVGQRLGMIRSRSRLTQDRYLGQGQIYRTIGFSPGNSASQTGRMATDIKNPAVIAAGLSETTR
jgi:hypothetical protein